MAAKKEIKDFSELNCPFCYYSLPLLSEPLQFSAWWQATIPHKEIRAEIT